jgi:hypothetical protein
MAKYRKKPVVIEAVQFDGNNIFSICDFMQTNISNIYVDGALVIPTLEGPLRASPGDYIIKGINGEFYPCKPDIFEKTYEKEGGSK